MLQSQHRHSHALQGGMCSASCLRKLACGPSTGRALETPNATPRPPAAPATGLTTNGLPLRSPPVGQRQLGRRPWLPLRKLVLLPPPMHTGVEATSGIRHRDHDRDRHRNTSQLGALPRTPAVSPAAPCSVLRSRAAFGIRTRRGVAGSRGTRVPLAGAAARSSFGMREQTQARNAGDGL
jgi:hypothetical protein